jgi:hypothetical protein
MSKMTALQYRDEDAVELAWGLQSHSMAGRESALDRVSQVVIVPTRAEPELDWEEVLARAFAKEAAA